ncbi:hypothetical protein ElyMa_000408300 [Elysia marginata]|uniref:Uncharacterized protein n=1 Tax=Elysia marginata TaxID=1093978 RepID=A0AAV4FMK8_9GAST|nr:hypothetical protein ElyMa_000408300 [Elysia marginata]
MSAPCQSPCLEADGTCLDISYEESATPAKSMNSYFISHERKFRGSPLTTLPVVFNKDLSRLLDSQLHLTSLEDLEQLRSIVRNRQSWRKLSMRIREAA